MADEHPRTPLRRRSASEADGAAGTRRSGTSCVRAASAALTATNSGSAQAESSSNGRHAGALSPSSQRSSRADRDHRSAHSRVADDLALNSGVAQLAPPVDLERARVIAAVHRWVADYGRPPRTIDWDPARARLYGRPELAEHFEGAGTWPKMTIVRRHFGGLRNLLRAAGYASAPTRIGRYRVEWTAAEILDAIRRWTELHEEPPTMADWDPYRARRMGQEWRVERYDAGEWPSVKSVRNHFGRLSDAIASAGLVPRRQGQRRPGQGPVLDPNVEIHVATIRGFSDKRAPAQRLAEAVKLVAAARERGEPADLRVALVQVAAVAMDWAATNR